MSILDNCLTDLTHNERPSIKLAYLHGYSRQELSFLLETNVNTVKSWLHRGMTQLQHQHERLSA
ncbi:MAG: RNA polymerase sigma-70 factor (ECF subfamily) [Alphaproteobacteria bacterium]|jgi:RNA polymerase sigma-70 factor (ECF subfamily)